MAPSPVQHLARSVGPAATARVLDEAHAQYTELGLYDPSGRREVFSARLRHELRRETHVIVGDHEPEPRT